VLNPPLVSGSLPPLINHAMDSARRQFPTNFKISFPTNFKMGHVERPLNWNIRKCSLISDFYHE